MAEAGLPVSELYPLPGAVSFESTLSGHAHFGTSKSSPEMTATPRPAGGPGNTCQEKPKQGVGIMRQENTVAPSTIGTDHSSMGVGIELHEQKHTSSREQSVPSSGASGPLHATSHHHQIAVKAINDPDPQAGRVGQSTKLASLPLLRGPSDTALPLLVTQGVLRPAPDRDACGRVAHRGADELIQEAQNRYTVACKQPMQLDQCNIITTIYRGASIGEGGIQQPQSRCVCASFPNGTPLGVEERGHPPPNCNCCGPYIPITNVEDRFAAYCHPQPIPAPAQLLPTSRLPGVEPGCVDMRPLAAPFVGTHLSPARLSSSVSETGLDTRHLLACCGANCPSISVLPLPGAVPRSPKHFSGSEECPGCPMGHVRTSTRETGTMTANKHLRDIGVQTEHTSIEPHVFPRISLTEDSRIETFGGQTPNSDSDGGKRPGGALKSPVKEVKWDAEGMTWEVYGASVDPEELGLAIQKHLELQIRETAIQAAAKLSRQNTNTSVQSKSSSSRRGKRSRMVGPFRAPACCIRSTSAVD